MTRQTGAAVALMLATVARASFTQPETEAIVAYWSEPGRYKVTAPLDAETNGPWQVRLTAAGSLWIWNYNKARGLGKVAPTVETIAPSEATRSWDRWIEAKIARDRWFATVSAANANEKALGHPVGTVPPEPTDPGTAPDTLVAFAGDPPPFAEAAAPMRHIVHFDDGMEIAYVDHVPMRANYAYYRFPQGVMFGGQSIRQMPDEELQALFAEAGVDASAQKVMKSVSLLEGGFDSVNTYDTGYVSVGFIQFACLSGGSGSLGSVLLDLRRNSPEAFQQDFRRFGIDVDDTAVLLVVDPTTGSLVRGPDAAMKIIGDKRLIAVFQRAGRLCRAFRMAQLRVARTRFYPADDDVSLMGNDGPMYGKVSDFIKSEAGLATLMDRKVNTGKTDPLLSVATRVAKARGAKCLADLAPFEREIVAGLRYRKDYLADASLSQPPALDPSLQAIRPTNATSRGGGTRGHRRKR